ncbi:MAG: hypothetical protein ACYCSF_05815 [Acidimicrobiales bacterium]
MSGAPVGVASELAEVREPRVRPLDHEFTADERRRKDRGDYYWGTRWDYLPTGKLQLRDDHGGYGPPLATDRQRWTVEERLPQLFAKLEEKAEIAEARRVEAELQRQKEQEAWEADLARAEVRLLEHHRVGWLTTQLDAYRMARDAREFVAASMLSRELDREEQEWLDWVAAYAEQIDPLHRALDPPPAPEPTSENLRPFLEGRRAGSGWR